MNSATRTTFSPTYTYSLKKASKCEVGKPAVISTPKLHQGIDKLSAAPQKLNESSIMRATLLVASLLFSGTTYAGNNIDFHNIKEQKLIETFQQNEKAPPSQKIKIFSSLFLGNSYFSGRLIGSNHTHEKLVVDFGKLDCFTYLDYVESLRRSSSIHNFVENVIRTRYTEGKVNYLFRKHFFSDWVNLEPRYVRDVTQSVSSHTITVTKQLNQKADGSPYIPGLKTKRRNISYIPGDTIDSNTLSKLKDGDYIGIYAQTPGLDVTHTGIFIRQANGPMLRNASRLSRNMKVVDSPFLDYVKKQPGIVVYRAIDAQSSQAQDMSDAKHYAAGLSAAARAE
ncbi:DUF1460 domain-containing protein [Chromobacterium vaccinii]|uniref:DUF1460 domain-containing protein n=1 Tax=Chromobacterium vaccinii TaxID=1108595 RepID=UPI000E193742|nr:DUF1460 domain-containing protein [Chromobacterium vaccinii]SUX55874.1 Protein of uncharacterised function (DUF1460) [Chromobacterium vaccinii]